MCVWGVCVCERGGVSNQSLTEHTRGVPAGRLREECDAEAAK